MASEIKPKFKRVLLKLSGEGLMGRLNFGIDEKVVAELAAEVAKLQQSGVELCLVIGGGIFFRGAKNAGKMMDRSVADQIGMMATVINALAMKSALEKCGCPAKIFSGLRMPQVCDAYVYRTALAAVEEKTVVIYAAGTGNPYFTTDTGAALRAAEMHCDVLMKATQVDGVYDSDPRQNPHAKRYAEISYAQVLGEHLNVMDITAVSMAAENNIPIMVFAQKGKDAIVKAVCGTAKHTMIK